MLRASLVVGSVAMSASLVTMPGAWAGPHHGHHRPVARAQVGAPMASVPRPARPPAPVPDRPVFLGYSQPIYPYLPAAQPFAVERAGPSAPAQNVIVTVNPFPVVVGIRRAPEAAPVIYRVADGREARRLWQERRRMAPSARVHQMEPDITTARIVVVRGGHRS